MTLIHFIKSLSGIELNVIGSAFSDRVSSAIKKTSLLAQFFDIVRHTPAEQITDAYIMDRLSISLSYKRYLKLRSRVLSVIIDRMCTDKYLRKNEIIKGTERAEVRIKKKLVVVQILRLKATRSDQDMFIHLLNEVTEEAKEFELYDTLIEALLYKQYHYAARVGYSEYLKVKEEIDLYTQCTIEKRKANNFYYELIANQKLISHFSEKEIGNFIDEKVKYLEASPYTTISQTIQYYYKLLKLAQQQKDDKRSESIDTCLEILNLLARSKTLARTERFGYIYGNLSQCLIYMRQFKQAAQTARTAQQYFAVDSLAYSIVAEQEFFACFYMKEYSRCREIINFLSGFSKKDAGQFRLDTATFNLAWLELVEGNYKTVSQLTSLPLIISKDKVRWDLGIRYLRILALIELKDYDSARDSIEALRKVVERNSVEGKIEVSARDQFIYRALNEFAQHDFQRCSSKLTYYLKQLSLKNTGKRWNFFTHEVIPIHRWLRKYSGMTKSKPGNKNLNHRKT